MGIAAFDETMLLQPQPLLLACLRLESSGDEQLAPLRSLASRYGGSLQIGVMNLAEDRRFRSRFNIMGVPTYIILKNGEESDRMLGKADEATLDSFLRQVLRLDQ